MLEINRDIYLKDTTNEKSPKYFETKKVVSEYIKTIKNSL